MSRWTNLSMNMNFCFNQKSSDPTSEHWNSKKQRISVSISISISSRHTKADECGARECEHCARLQRHGGSRMPCRHSASDIVERGMMHTKVLPGAQLHLPGRGLPAPPLGRCQAPGWYCRQCMGHSMPGSGDSGMHLVTGGKRFPWFQREAQAARVSDKAPRIPDELHHELGHRLGPAARSELHPVPHCSSEPGGPMYCVRASASVSGSRTACQGTCVHVGKIQGRDGDDEV